VARWQTSAAVEVVEGEVAELMRAEGTGAQETRRLHAARADVAREDPLNLQVVRSCNSRSNDAVLRCAKLIEQAQGLLITAGAGMGVDAGLPDFRSANGFWRAYLALANAGVCFEDIAAPQTFTHNPELAWGFYGHRLNLYRRTEPHDGYRLLLEWGRSLPHGAFVFTSNVDGLFQKAGFDGKRVVECHGSIHRLQCVASCSERLWSAKRFRPVIDETVCRLVSPLPKCPRCGALARPNILMFDDWEWVDYRTQLQRKRLNDWLIRAQSLLVIELGAGTRIPTVRDFGERLGQPLIRINPTEPELGVAMGVSLRLGALDALRGIEDTLRLRRSQLDLTYENQCTPPES
jgi:NAD-dependent SIR2 family protein deacetylase